MIGILEVIYCYSLFIHRFKCSLPIRVREIGLHFVSQSQVLSEDSPDALLRQVTLGGEGQELPHDREKIEQESEEAEGTGIPPISSTFHEPASITPNKWYNAVFWTTVSILQTAHC